MSEAAYLCEALLSTRQGDVGSVAVWGSQLNCVVSSAVPRTDQIAY